MQDYNDATDPPAIYPHFTLLYFHPGYDRKHERHLLIHLDQLVSRKLAIVLERKTIDHRFHISQPMHMYNIAVKWN